MNLNDSSNQIQELGKLPFSAGDVAIHVPSDTLWAVDNEKQALRKFRWSDLQSLATRSQLPSAHIFRCGVNDKGDVATIGPVKEPVRFVNDELEVYRSLPRDNEVAIGGAPDGFVALSISQATSDYLIRKYDTNGDEAFSVLLPNTSEAGLARSPSAIHAFGNEIYAAVCCRGIAVYVFSREGAPLSKRHIPLPVGANVQTTEAGFTTASILAHHFKWVGPETVTFQYSLENAVQKYLVVYSVQADHPQYAYELPPTFFRLITLIENTAIGIYDETFQESKTTGSRIVAIPLSRLKRCLLSDLIEAAAKPPPPKKREWSLWGWSVKFTRR